jgi:hypothetical protein
MEFYLRGRGGASSTSPQAGRDLHQKTVDIRPMTLSAGSTLELDSPRQLRARESDRIRSDNKTARRVMVGLCIAIVVAIHLTDLFRPFPGDGAMFIVMGKIVSQGGGIGRDIIDNKFPTVGLLTSGGWALAGTNWLMWVILLAAIGVTGPILLARNAGRYLGKHAALPTFLFALIYLNFSYGVDGFHLEAVQVFFTAIAASAALAALTADDARDSFLVGLSAGMAAMLKPTGLAVLGAFALTIIFCCRHRINRIAAHAVAALGGLLIPAVVTLVYLVGADLLREIPVISRQIARYGAQSHWESSNWIKWGIVIAVIGFPLFVRGVIFRRERNRAPVRLNTSVAIFALVWLVIEALGVTAQGRMYKYHFLTLTAPAAVLYGMLPRRDRTAPLIAALALPLLLSVIGEMLVTDRFVSPSQRLSASEYLSAHATPGDRVWADTMTRLLIETNLQPGSSYFSTFLWANDDDAPLTDCRAMLAQFEQRRPKYILLPADLDEHVEGYVDGIDELRHNPRRAAGYRQAWSELRSYVLQHYAPEARVEDLIVYHRSDNPQPHQQTEHN